MKETVVDNRHQQPERQLRAQYIEWIQSELENKLPFLDDETVVRSIDSFLEAEGRRLADLTESDLVEIAEQVFHGVEEEG